MTERDQFLVDVLICAVEDYSLNQWRQIEAYKLSAIEADPNSDEAHVIIIEIGDGDLDFEHKFNITTIAKGISEIVNGEVIVHPDITDTVIHADATNEAGDIDAEIADVILQVGLFKEVRYG